MPPISQLLANQAPIGDADPAYDSLLGQLQCNILSSHGRYISRYFSFELPAGPGAARKLCRELAAGSWSGAPAGLALRSELALRAERGEARDRKSKGSPLTPAQKAQAPFAVNLLLSASAYAKLGGLKLPDDPAFGQGMRGYEAAQTVGPKLNDRFAAGSGLDLLYIVAAHPEQHQQLDLVESRLREYLAPISVTTEKGRVIMHKKPSAKPQEGKEEKDPVPAEDNYAIEPFGYRDGISMPRFFASDLAARRQDEGAAATVQGGHWRSFAPLNRVLLADPNVGGDACGTYFVYRKIRQKVAEFYRQAHKLANDTGRHWEQIADELVGRRPDGTPLVPSNNNLNDFNYEKSSLCPAHAHMRKVNPREGWTHKHQIVRRATVYGPRLQREDNGRPKFDQKGELEPVDAKLAPQDVHTGLLFLCAQESITQQFLTLQANWANHTGKGGADAIAAQLASGQKNLIDAKSPSQPSTGRNNEYEPVVQALGGEYFFAPSLTCFTQL